MALEKICIECNIDEEKSAHPPLKIFSTPMLSTQKDFGAPSNTASHIRYAHIYLEGDGTPWIRGIHPANIPKVKNPVALKLMLKDQHPLTFYITRPCYAYRHLPETCKEADWTSGRYSQHIVDRINKAIDVIKSGNHIDYFRLVGFSGGGTLAVLIAKHRDDVSAVITLGANIDHHTWTRHFGYDELSQSLDPTTLQSLPQTVKQLYFWGEKDSVVPVALSENIRKHEPYANMKIIPNFDHHCCWEALWDLRLEEMLEKYSHSDKTAIERQ